MADLSRKKWTQETWALEFQLNIEDHDFLIRRVLQRVVQAVQQDHKEWAWLILRHEPKRKSISQLLDQIQTRGEKYKEKIAADGKITEEAIFLLIEGCGLASKASHAASRYLRQIIEDVPSGDEFSRQLEVLEGSLDSASHFQSDDADEEEEESD